LITKFIALYVERCRFKHALAFWQHRTKLPEFDLGKGKKGRVTCPTPGMLFAEMKHNLKVKVELMDGLVVASKHKKSKQKKDEHMLESHDELDSPASPNIDVPSSCKWSHMVDCDKKNTISNMADFYMIDPDPHEKTSEGMQQLKENIEAIDFN